MSSKKTLALQFVGPMQSWGFDSQFNRRNTGLMPTKSAVAGICCAALGYSRGSGDEKVFLNSFKDVRMTAIALPRGKNLPVRRIEDWHTVGGGYDPDNPVERYHITVIAKDGSPRAKNGQSLAVLTHRQYLADASFGVLLEGDAELLEKTATALRDPKWGVWLGRKCCIPSAPVLAGLREDRDEALRLLIGDRPLESFTRQKEVENFADGRDSLPDVPTSFATDGRSFSPRRVITLQSGQHEAVK